MATAVAYDEQQLAPLRAFAMAPENVYEPKTADFIPGDRPGYVAEVTATVMSPSVGMLEQRLRIVFSITKVDEIRYRHLSASLVSGDTSGIDETLARGPSGVLKVKSVGLPAPSAFEAIGLALGFRGRLTTWDITVEQERVIVAMQRLEDA